MITYAKDIDVCCDLCGAAMCENVTDDKCVYTCKSCGQLHAISSDGHTSRRTTLFPQRMSGRMRKKCILYRKHVTQIGLRGRRMLNLLTPMQYADEMNELDAASKEALASIKPWWKFWSRS